MSLVAKIRGGGKGSGTRKTVTFGDAAEVKGSPGWSVVSLLGLFGIWWFIKQGSEPMVNDRTFPSLRQALAFFRQALAKEAAELRLTVA